MSLRKLSPRQFEILRCIIDFINDVGYPPTFLEIMKAFNFKSKNAITGHIRMLEKKGYIGRYFKGEARSIVVLFDMQGFAVETKVRRCENEN